MSSTPSEPIIRNTSPQGALAVVATPLGNIDDLSDRARATLRNADLILAEDTRTVRRLLSESGSARTGQLILSCFDGNEDARAQEAVQRISDGQTVALVSEAGTPMVSDPGFRVVTAIIAAGLRVRPVPGPSALLAALMGAGIAPDHFTFLAFPPRKPGARRRLFDSVKSSPFTLVFYESPLRTAETLKDLAAALGGRRRACVARELTKTHEEFVRGSLDELVARYQDQRPLGEVTLVVAGLNDPSTEADVWSDEDVTEEARELLATGMSVRDIADRLAERIPRARREIYKLATAVADATDSAPSEQDDDAP